MNKTALITGASNGIGLELARIHAKTGGDLVLVARHVDRLEALKFELTKLHNTNVYIIGKDLSVPNAAKEVYNELKEQEIEIEYLINNAGFGEFGEFRATSWEKESAMIQLNIITLTHFTKLFLPDLLKKNQGKIMNVASIAAFLPGPYMAVYFATKSFVLHFSEAINEEIRNSEVTITTFCPGPTATGFMKVASMENSKMIKGKKLPTADEVAKQGYVAMIQGVSVSIPGLLNNIMATSVRFVPRNLIVKLMRWMQGI
jgi:hypothetical protein